MTLDLAPTVRATKKSLMICGRKSATTFGPVGRVLWTVAVLLVAAMTVFSQDSFAIVPICLIGAPLVLRSVWAPGRVA